MQRLKYQLRRGVKSWTPETMKLLGSNNSQITEDKNGGNVRHLESTEALLVRFNIMNNDY